ncbi:hypothetical protein GGI25_001646 [Coemansia spiralis]|uniref:Uncharacterized protein n=2 Tax=Coemansia TaxID=4863 RepID=A0A9W8GC94_9FUNG|nr:hypothetical protein EDC05_003326 [Coemansia umbellata]KAJ2623923.1 hypothetical protein GGI26_001938 [Coemansia sp. RSA 1358]KAJ2679290.1 hypothetical protein GGI25_001646 [Coemansia spiralis]
MPQKKTIAKKGKKRCDPSAYATVSIPSKASLAVKEEEIIDTADIKDTKAEIDSSLAVSVDTATSDPALSSSNVLFPDMLSGEYEPQPERVLLAAKDASSVDAWVSLDLARRQANDYVRSELSMKESLDANCPIVLLTQKSEQLVVDKIREKAVKLANPDISAVLSVRDWTRSACFVYETLAAYKFAEDDIVAAMRATSGTGDLVDAVAWLCFHVPSERMPIDMRDKFEYSLFPKASSDEQKQQQQQEEEEEEKVELVGPAKDSPDDPADLADVLFEKARINSSSDSEDVEEVSNGIADNNAPGPLLVELLSRRFLSEYEAGGYDSEEDPNITHARRSIRLSACSEILDYYQSNSSTPKRKESIELLSKLIDKERKGIRAIEDDALFDDLRAVREFERVWPVYYDSLLNDICELKEKEQTYLGASTGSSETGSNCKQGLSNVCNGKGGSNKKWAAVFDTVASGDSDDDIGFGFDLGLGLAGDDEPRDNKVLSQPLPSIRVFDTRPPVNWAGAAVKDIVLEEIRRLDKQATIKYSSLDIGEGYSCKLTVDWRLPTKARLIAEIQRAVPIDPAPEFAFTGLKQAWSLPRSLLGKTKRDAEDLCALVLLYMQPTLCHKVSLRLLPTLRDLWEEWEATNSQTAKDAAQEALVSRTGFLRELRVQYEMAAQKALDEDQPVISVFRPHVPSSRLAYMRRAQHIRKHKWSKETISSRHKNKKYENEFEAMYKALPARMFRREIIQGVMENQVIIIRGETGSGKSSQIPQFLLELLLNSAYKGGRVICTQPRRISAMSIASRVSKELGDPALGGKDSLVGCQIRLNSQASDENALVFCTTGVLLRMLVDDPELRDVSCIICDEVQERTLELDYMLIVIRQLLPKRQDLKVILMSATIDTSIFSCYFDDCPIVEIPGRTFPVNRLFLENVVQMAEYTLESSSRYAIRTPYPQQPLYAESTAHSFAITGRDNSSYQEIVNVDSNMLLDGSNGDTRDFNRDFALQNADYISKTAMATVKRMRTDIVNLDLIHHLLREICTADDGDTAGCLLRTFSKNNVPTGSVLVFLPGIYEIRTLSSILASDPLITNVMSVIPLHSSFANDKPSYTHMTYTELAFAPPVKRKRKVILSTNVAETGVTIPDITIVIDCGLSNQNMWDKERHVSRLLTKPVSKANVKQRCGRAGRVQAGVALCLYTKEQYSQMADYERPEMQRMSLVNLCLQTKSHGVEDIMHFLQQAMEPPQQSAVIQAIHELQEAGALDENENLTPIGSHLCYLPLDLSVGKLLIVGSLFNCLDPILTVAASLSANSGILVTPFDGDARHLAQVAHIKYRKPMGILPYVLNVAQSSDFLVILAAYEDWRKYASRPEASHRELLSFCKANWLSMDALEEIEECREQYLRLLYSLGLVQIERPKDAKDWTLSQAIRPFIRKAGAHRGFTVVPEAANANGNDVNIIYAAIVAGLNHILMASTIQSGYVIGKSTIARRIQGIESGALQAVDRERVATRPIQIDPLSVVASNCQMDKNNALVAASLSANSRSMSAHMLTKVNLVPIVLFSRSLSYWPKAQRLVVNKWIASKCYARTASVLMMMRRLLEQIMQFRFAFPQRELPENLAKWQSIIIDVIKNEHV